MPKKKSKKVQEKQEDILVHPQSSRMKGNVEIEKSATRSVIYIMEPHQSTEILKLSSERVKNIEEKWLEFKAETKKAEEWQRYLICNKLPDPTDLPQMNSFRYMWTEMERDTSMSYCLKKSEEVMQLLGDLNEAISDPGPQCPPSLLKGWKILRNEIRDLLRSQIDKATYKLFRRIETDMVPIDVTTSQYYCETKHFTMHLWAELITPIPSTGSTETRHPLKVSFQPADLKITIPVDLLQIHKVIRVMYLSYDHWSDRCRSFDCTSFSRHSKDMLLLPEESSKKALVVQSHENPTDLTKTNTNIAPIAYSKELVRGAAEVVHAEVVEEELVQDSLLVWLRDFEVNLREREFLGGVIVLDILHQPPQPKLLRYKHDVTLLLRPPVLEPVDYNVKYPPERLSFFGKENGEAKDLEQGAEALENKEEYKILCENQQKKLITVELSLPQNIFWFEVPEVAIWCERNECWTTQHIHDVQFDEEEQKMTFKMGALGLIGLHVNRFCNLPYEDWELSGDGEGGVNFYLKAAKITMSFKIKENQVCLENLKDFPKVPHEGLLKTFHTPLKLVQMLRSFGINVFPEADSNLYIGGLSPKHTMCENYAYQIWGLFSLSFCFRFSKFNRYRGRREFVFQLREVYKSYETSFCLLRMTPSEASILDITENSDSYSSDRAEGMQKCGDIYSLIIKYCTSEAKRKADSTSFVLVQTVAELLQFIRPLSFS